MHGSEKPNVPDGPDAPETHVAASLVLGTLVASPVLLAALSGRQAVPSALALYLAAIVGSWFVVGLVGGALQLTREPGPDRAGALGVDGGGEPDESEDDRADGTAATAAGERSDPVGVTR